GDLPRPPALLLRRRCIDARQDEGRRGRPVRRRVVPRRPAGQGARGEDLGVETRLRLERRRRWVPMSQLYERTSRSTRPMPDEALLDEPRATDSGTGTLLRVLGGLAVLVVGAVHLEQYFAVHFDVVPVIGPLFALNFAGAVVIGLGLLLP